MIRIGFTGTQNGLTDAQEAALDRLFAELEHHAIEFHHDDCIGADARAHDLADNYTFDIEIHPPDKDNKRAFCTGGIIHPEKPYLDRNKDIVDCCDTLIACPNGEERLRSGTWSTVRYARKRASIDRVQIKIWIITPSGEIRREGR